MSHVTCMNESCHTYEWVMCNAYEWVVSHTFFDGYCSTVQGWLDWFEVDLGFTECSFIQIDLCHVSRIWMSRVTHMNESFNAYESVMSHIHIRHVTHMNESCLTHTGGRAAKGRCPRKSRTQTAGAYVCAWARECVLVCLYVDVCVKKRESNANDRCVCVCERERLCVRVFVWMCVCEREKAKRKRQVSTYVRVRECVYLRETKRNTLYRNRVATVSKIDSIIGVFCKSAL